MRLVLAGCAVIALAGVAVADPVADHAKARAGTWSCKGNTQVGDGSSTPWTAKLVVKLDVDNAWVQMSLAGSTGGITRYRSYDASSGQWTQIELQTTSAHLEATSPGEQNGVWTFTGLLVGPTGSVQVMEHEQLDGKQLKLWGENLLAGSWQKTYEGTCVR